MTEFDHIDKKTKTNSDFDSNTSRPISSIRSIKIKKRFPSELKKFSAFLSTDKDNHLLSFSDGIWDLDKLKDRQYQFYRSAGCFQSDQNLSKENVPDVYLYLKANISRNRGDFLLEMKQHFENDKMISRFLHQRSLLIHLYSFFLQLSSLENILQTCKDEAFIKNIWDFTLEWLERLLKESSRKEWFVLYDFLCCCACILHWSHLGLSEQTNSALFASKEIENSIPFILRKILPSTSGNHYNNYNTNETASTNSQFHISDLTRDVFECSHKAKQLLKHLEQKQSQEDGEVQDDPHFLKFLVQSSQLSKQLPSLSSQQLLQQNYRYYKKSFLKHFSTIYDAESVPFSITTEGKVKYWKWQNSNSKFSCSPLKEIIQSIQPLLEKEKSSNIKSQFLSHWSPAEFVHFGIDLNHFHSKASSLDFLSSFQDISDLGRDLVIEFGISIGLDGFLL